MKTTSYQNGYTTAELELKTGYPAYFYVAGCGSIICAVDGTYGLPIRLGGDCCPDIEWMCGFNNAVKKFAKSQRLPWNSRKASLDILCDLPTYFHSRMDQAVDLGANELNFGSIRISLDLNGPLGNSLKLKSDNLFIDPGLVPGAMGAYRKGPPPKILSDSPKSPSWSTGEKNILLGHYGGRAISTKYLNYLK